MALIDPSPFSTLNRSREIDHERMPKGGFGGLTSGAIIM